MSASLGDHEVSDGVAGVSSASRSTNFMITQQSGVYRVNPQLGFPRFRLF